MPIVFHPTRPTPLSVVRKSSRIYIDHRASEQARERARVANIKRNIFRQLLIALNIAMWHKTNFRFLVRTSSLRCFKLVRMLASPLLFFSSLAFCFSRLFIVCLIFNGRPSYTIYQHTICRIDVKEKADYKTWSKVIAIGFVES